jgi:SAM-dependent methyltransferase
MNASLTMPPTNSPATNAGEAFGRLASSYDEDFESLPAARRLRKIVWGIYLRYFKPGDSLVELNCGTGTDALALAQQGLRVHATDISDAMLDALRQKVSRSPQKDLVTAQRLAFDELNILRGRMFDGVYSNMGGLNCEGNLRRVAADLHALIRPGGFFIGTFLGDVAIWEMLAFAARGKLKQAFRRRTPGGSPANVAGSTVQTFYYSPGTVADVFSPHFTRVEVLGLNIFTPPPTSQQAYRRFGKSIRLFERIDDTVMRHSPFSRFGDHFVIVLKHK